MPCKTAFTVRHIGITEAAEDMARLSGVMDHPLMRSFIAFSIFRAFYGAGILVVTYFVDRETSIPWWLFLAFSMVFSRVLFRWIKASRSRGVLPSDHQGELHDREL